MTWELLVNCKYDFEISNEISLKESRTEGERVREIESKRETEREKERERETHLNWIPLQLITILHSEYVPVNRCMMSARNDMRPNPLVFICPPHLIWKFHNVDEFYCCYAYFMKWTRIQRRDPNQLHAQNYIKVGARAKKPNKKKSTKLFEPPWITLNVRRTFLSMASCRIFVQIIFSRNVKPAGE